MRYSFSKLSNNTPKTLKMNKNSNPNLRSLFSAKLAFYRKKSNGGGCTKIGGANTPPIALTKLRKRG